MLRDAEATIDKGCSALRPMCLEKEIDCSIVVLLQHRSEKDLSHVTPCIGPVNYTPIEKIKESQIDLFSSRSTFFRHLAFVTGVEDRLHSLSAVMHN